MYLKVCHLQKEKLRKLGKIQTRNNTAPANSAITESIRKMGTYCLKIIDKNWRNFFKLLVTLPKEVVCTQILAMNLSFKDFIILNFLKQVPMKMSLQAKSSFNLFLNQFRGDRN